MYVAPNGSDNNPGTVDQPFQTIQKAQQVVRASIADQQSDIRVNFRGGTYTLAEPLLFTAADSGGNGHTIVYQAFDGEKPIISGGFGVSGWQRDTADARIWRAQLNVSQPIRQLYVNGVRAIRARTNQALPAYPKSSDGMGYYVTSPDISAWKNPSDVEVVGVNQWKEFRCGVAAVSNGKIIMRQPCWSYAQADVWTPMNSPAYLENARELLDFPGEWYFDRTSGWISYYPYPDEDMTRAEAVVPILETLIDGAGTEAESVHDISFRGLTFAYATWLRPSGEQGYVPLQSGNIFSGAWDFERIAANVHWQHAQSIKFEGNFFIHLGGSALGFEHGSEENHIIGNHFSDISGAGIQVGGFDDPWALNGKMTRANVITNNYLRNTGVEYADNAALWLGYVRDNEISHNEITNVPYSGISIGWGWGGQDPTIAGGNSMNYNYVHRHMKYLRDGGGIYSLSAQPGSSIIGNLITDQGHGGGAIYLDQGSRYIMVSGNVLLRNPLSVGVYGGDVTVRDNWWDSESVTNVTPARFGPNTWINNRLIARESDAPQDVVDFAGLRPDYLYMRQFSNPTYMGHSCTPNGDRVQLTWVGATDATSYVVGIDAAVVAITEDTQVEQQVDCGRQYFAYAHLPDDQRIKARTTFTCPCAAPDNAPGQPAPQPVPVPEDTASPASKNIIQPDVSHPPVEAVVPTAPVRASSLSEASTPNPVWKILPSVRSGYKMTVGKKQVILRPFGVAYKGIVFVRRFDFVSGKTLYLLANRDQVESGGLALYDSLGKKIATYDALGKDARQGMILDAISDNQGQMYLLAVARNKSGVTQAYRITERGLVNAGRTKGQGTVTGKLLRLDTGEIGVYTLQKKPAKNSLWVYRDSMQRFVEVKNADIYGIAAINQKKR